MKRIIVIKNLLIVAVTLLVFAADVAGQDTQATFQFTVPYRLSTVDTSITRLQAVCRLGRRKANGKLEYVEASGNRVSWTGNAHEAQAFTSGERAIKDMTFNAQGSYAGEFTFRFVLSVPPGAAGTAGEYECGMMMCTHSGAEGLKPMAACQYLDKLGGLVDAMRGAAPNAPAPALVNGTFKF